MAARTARPARPPTRRAPTLAVERELFAGGCQRLAALDEVGRGALAGPVSVGVVVVTAPMHRAPRGLKDSKLLTAAARTALVAPIRAWAPECAVGHAEPAEIDAIGIMGALRLAAQRALAALSEPVDALLLDGNHDYLSAPAGGVDFPTAGTGGAAPYVTAASQPALPTPPVHLRVKADRDCASVAAASVLAKVTRDALMVDLAGRYPAFGWADNKGYGTAAHLAAIARHGPCELHRRSWSLPEFAAGTLDAPEPIVAAMSALPAAVGDDGCDGRVGAAGGTVRKGA